MKRITTILTLLVFFIMLSCEKKDKESENQTGKITFSIQEDALKSTNIEIINAKKIIISVLDENGICVHELTPVAIYKFNEVFISEPVALKPGNYKLTAFFVSDENDSILYVTPVEGSKLDYLVNDPLPIHFSVSSNETTKVSVEVISACQGVPEDFGYATFGFSLIKTFNFCIAAFEYVGDSSNFELTEAEVFVYSDNNLIYSGEISAALNSILLPETENYLITIKKEGFSGQSIEIYKDSMFIYDCSSGGKPFTVILKKIVNCETGIFTDERDGINYKWAKIGNQTWMAENLKTKTYLNGDVIPDGKGIGDYSNEIEPKYQFAYNDNEAYVDTFGRLYTWYAVTDLRGVCPSGWHVPSDSEWKELSVNLGMNPYETDAICSLENDISGKLKETGNDHWSFPNIGATDEVCFNALPSGVRRRYYQEFRDLGDFATFWSSTEMDSEYAWYMHLYNYSAGICRTYNYKNYGFSVRCVKDE